MTAKALERLCELGLAQRASEAQSGLSYIILPEARPLVEEAVLAMDDAFIAKRAAAWKIDVRGRLEWIEGMDEMIRKGKESYYANLR